MLLNKAFTLSLFGLIMAALIGVAIWGGLTVLDIVRQMDDGYRSLKVAADSLRSLSELSVDEIEQGSFNPDEIYAQLVEAEETFQRIDRRLGDLGGLVSLGEQLPHVGLPLKAAPDFIDLAVNTSVAGQTIYNGTSDIYAFLDRLLDSAEVDLDDILNSEFKDLLSEGTPYLTEGQQQLAQVIQQSHTVDWPVLPDKFEQLYLDLEAEYPHIDSVLDSVIAAPDMLEDFELGYHAMSEAVDSLRPVSTLSIDELNTSVLDLDEIAAQLAEAEASLSAAKEGFDNLDFLNSLSDSEPEIGQILEAAPEFMELAIDASVAGQSACQGGRPLYVFLEEITNSSESYPIEDLSSQLISALESGSPDIAKAQYQLANVMDKSRTVDWDVLPGDYREIYQSIEDDYPYLDKLLEWAMAAPDLLRTALGYDEPKTYITLTLCDDELRAIGGFFSLYGQVILQNGSIVTDEYQMVYSPGLKIPELTEPIDVPPWWFVPTEPAKLRWNSNWKAGFPEFAEDAEWFFETGGNTSEPVDGIIAIDMTGMEYLLDIIGEVYVPDYDERINSNNLRDRVYSYYNNPTELDGRGTVFGHYAFLENMAPILIDRLRQIEADEIEDLIRAITQALDEKHLIAYFDDSDLQSEISSMGWDGAIHQTSGDYLMVIDAAVQGTKASNLIVEDIDHSVIIQPDGNLRCTVTLTYEYDFGRASVYPACSKDIGCQEWEWTLVRVYVPDGSIWQATEGTLFTTQITSENGKTAFVNLHPIHNTGDITQITHSYIIPPGTLSTSGDSYRLFVQKQPGTVAHDLTITLTLPEGTQILGSNPIPTEIDGNTVRFESSLRTDQEFLVTFE